MRPILWLIHFFNIDLPMENNQAETCAVKNTVVDVIDTQISPEGRLEVLSKAEVHKLLDNSHGGLHQIFRNCSLAVLNCGNYLDDGKELLERYASFDISIIQRERGIKLDIKGAPANAFVDNKMIKGIHEHLFAVLRDVLFVSDEIQDNPQFDLNSSEGITDAVFHILRNANVLRPQTNPNLVVCWGGHSISRTEYDYSKTVGYELGLRALDICTGCGPGAMKGPMKGATIGHARQRIAGGRYLGMTEPGIIAAESPNPIVNDLVIMPDIENGLRHSCVSAMASWSFPAAQGRPRKFCTSLAFSCIRAMRICPSRLFLPGRRNLRLTSRRSMNSSVSLWAAWRSAATRSSSMIRRAWRRKCWLASNRCANSAKSAAMPIISIGR